MIAAKRKDTSTESDKTQSSVQKNAMVKERTEEYSCVKQHCNGCRGE
jgi:hypothetical protein